LFSYELCSPENSSLYTRERSDKFIVFIYINMEEDNESVDSDEYVKDDKYDNKSVKNIKKENSFIKHLKENFKLNNIVKIDKCDICFYNKSLVTKCFVCKYPFCVDCYSQILNSSCPYCRSKI